MSIPFMNRADCMRAWEAMPQVLQQPAASGHSEWLSTHLAGCSDCREVFAQQRRLRLALSLPTGVRLDANVGLRRLLDRIDAAGRAPVTAPSRARAGWLKRGLLAAVMVQAVGLSVMGVTLRVAAPPATYRTLSEESAPAPAGTIRVVPDADMALTDWNALLHVLHLRVVGGPDTAGAYTVAPMSPAATTRHTLQQLRATHGIRLAESITAAR